MGDVKITDLDDDDDLEKAKVEAGEKVVAAGEGEEIDDEELDDVAGGVTRIATAGTVKLQGPSLESPLQSGEALLKNPDALLKKDPGSLKIGRGGSVFGPRG